jgi:gliding motility-associated-like protein
VFYDTVEVVLTGPANVNLGPDTAICIGQYIDLNAGYSGSTYQWFRKDAAQQFILIDSLQTLRIDTTGIYVAAVDNGCGWRYDTIDVEVLEIPTQVFGDTVGICQGSTRTLDAGYWGKSATYLWDDGSANRINTLSTPGPHSVLITNPCGTYLNNFYLRYDQTYSIDLGPDDTVCDTQYIIDLNLNLTQTDTILWSNGVDKPINTVSHTGTYWVRVTNDCGVYTDTIEVLFLNPPSISFDDFSVCAGGGHTLSVVSKPGTSHLWSTGDTTSSINITQSGTYWARSYNKCDTVSDTVQVSFDQPINFSLGPDVTICEPGIAVLSAGNIGLLGADSVRWNTGSKNSVLVVSASGTYIAKLYNSCGIFADTVNVTIKKLPVSKLSNTAFCVGGGVVLDADQNAPNTTYNWSTGVNTASINVTTPGQYWVEITNDCGTIVDSVYVREDFPLPQIDLGNDTVFCQGVLWLDPGYVAGATYLWQNGFTSQAFVVAQSGEYHVKMENSCGAVYDTINVLITGPPQPTLGSLVHFCSGHSLVLNAENPGCKYKWSTGDSTQQILISSPGVYSVEISNDCGSITDSVEVRIEYPIENLDLGPDTIICLGQQLILDPGYSGVRRLWSNGIGLPTLTVNQTGLYWVDLFNSCGVFSDSIYVEVQGLPVFSLGNDTVICSVNGQLDLYGPPGMIDYEWSNGGSNQSTRFTTSGKHWLKVTNSCFSYTDTILVVEEYPLILNLGPDTAVCETETYILDAGIYNYPVYWNDQSISATMEVRETGWYWAYSQNSCGFVSDSVYVQIDTIVEPAVIDTILCDEDSLTLDLSDYLYDFVWFDGSAEKIRTFSEEGTYPITLFNKCGVFEREFEVILSDCDCPIYIANSFTPNGDQLNDEFKVINNCLIEDYSIQIFSRWGARVFYSEDPDATWNGVFDGKIMPSGVYTYKVYYKWKVYQLDRHKTRHGTINLIR